MFNVVLRSLAIIVAVAGISAIVRQTETAQSADQPVTITPIKELVKHFDTALHEWKLHAYDEEPSVAVEGYRGFRLVLRITRETHLGSQNALPKNDVVLRRDEDWEFVLIPVAPQSPPETIKMLIPWRKSDSYQETRDLCLGEGFGYVWFTRGTLDAQDDVRETLKLQGGDDRLQLAMDGLLLNDAKTPLDCSTAEGCEFIPTKFGDRALPYIEKTIQEFEKTKDLLFVVTSLAHIKTDRSTELLLKLFDSQNEDLKHAAEFALIHEPYRKAAKRAYLDMLRRHSRVNELSDASIKFEWKDAVPILSDLIAHPHDESELRSAITARRTLEGRPVSQELLDAEQAVRELSGPRYDAARRLLIETDDAEFANLVALTLAIMTSKGGAKSHNAVGLGILGSRPRSSTATFLKSLAAGDNKDENFRPRIRAVLKEISDASVP